MTCSRAASSPAFRAAIIAFLVALLAMVVPLIILGGILSGLTTITEASGFAAVYAIVIGTVMDVLPALVVIVPVLVPAMIQLGFDPLHFAILMIVVLNISNVTPPVGMTLMTAARIAEVPYERAIVASLPFYVSFLMVIVLLAAFPALSTWIPSLL